MLSGFGNLIGFIGNGWWRHACMVDGVTHWPRFWYGVSGAAALVWVWFFFSYRGRHTTS